MDRRLVLAFVLSTALILAYQFLYYGPRMRKYQEAKHQAELIEHAMQRADSLAAVAAADTAGTPQEPDLSANEPEQEKLEPVEAAPAGLPKATPASAEKILVTTDLYQVTLSTRGGEIISASLLDYKTNGEPVQLVNDEATPERGLCNLTLAGDRESRGLSDVRFEAFYPGGSEPLMNGTEVRLGESSQEKTIEMRVDTPDGGKIVRSYTFANGSYMIRAGVRFSAASFPFTRSVVWGLGNGLRTTEKNTRDDIRGFRATVRLGDEYRKQKLNTFSESYEGNLHWAALQTKYFASILVPPEPVAGKAVQSGNKDLQLLTTDIELPSVERGGRVQQSVDLYIGPLDYRLLKGYGRGFDKIVDIGFQHLKIFQPLSLGILWSILWLHKVIPNYGLVIIIISVLTKVLFYRLTHKSFKSMRDMQALQPRMQALKEKYKDDRQKMSQETMKLYKEAGVNPLGGCLPMVLQMPVFIALFNVLRNTIELRRAPFVGWINDLSQQDVLFQLPVTLPIVGNAFSVMPILMGASMLMQSKIGGGIAGPSSTATQPKAMTYMLPIVFTVLFYRMPSGLVLYWLINTVLSIAQQYYINKGAEATAAASAGNDTAKPLKAPGPVPPAPSDGDGNAPSRPNRSRSRRRKSKAKQRPRKG